MRRAWVGGMEIGMRHGLEPPAATGFSAKRPGRFQAQWPQGHGACRRSGNCAIVAATLTGRLFSERNPKETRMFRYLWCLLSAITLSAMALSVDAKSYKEITIATDATYPPFESVAADGQLVGFEIDLSHALCEELKLKCRLINASFDTLIPGLVTRKSDALITSMNINDERKRVIDFTDPYYRMESRFVARKGAGIVISAAGLTGKTIAVQAGTLQASYVRKVYGDVARIKYYQGGSEPFLELLSGRADLHFGFIVQVNDSFLSKDGKDFEFIGPTLSGKDDKTLGEGVAIAIRKEDKELKALLNQGLQTLRKNGTMKKINDKYFPFTLVMD
ncbi:ABC transporter substrate-binding protein [Verminephrobacter eiseniae]|nr:ABC transporter substrate-binding protein [Verminephrobacter eiseniae]